MKARAVFLDRDGTIIEDRHFVADPDDVRLLPGAAEAVRRFRDAGYLVVVASNQSGVARGLFDTDALAAVHARMEELLTAGGARLDGTHYCPYLDGPEAKIAAYRRDSDLRKPKPGMLHQAADELDIDLSQSWMVGDSQRDMEAGDRAGCRTILVGGGAGHGPETVSATHCAADLLEASIIVEQEMKQGRDDPSDTRGSLQSDAALTVLQEISDRLDRAHRDDRQQDFSLLRLFGALVQMFAIVTVIWGLVALSSDEPAEATARFCLAGFLQLATLSAFAVDRFR